MTSTICRINEACHTLVTLVAQAELASRLDDYLNHLRETGLRDDALPLSAAA